MFAPGRGPVTKPANLQLLPTHIFVRRLARSAVTFVLLVGGSLVLGILGYHWVGELPWLDALLNASMILTGMGPVDRMETAPAKLFASFYAIFSGVAFLTSIGLFLAPVVHRVLHRFHIEAEDSQS
jgi:hypothetical protein